MDIVDGPKIYNRVMNDWNIWTNPLKGGFWYSQNYFNEVMDALNNASSGLKVIFVVLNPPQKMTEIDHKMIEIDNE